MTFTPAASSTRAVGSSTPTEHERAVMVGPASTPAAPAASAPVSGASAHIASLRDQRARARLVLAPDAELPLVDPSTPDIHAYLDTLPTQSQLAEVLGRPHTKKKIRRAVIEAGAHPDGASITQLLRLYDEQARAELPPALKTQRLEDESILLRCSSISQKLTHNKICGRSDNAGASLRSATTAYVAARHQLAFDKFPTVFRRVQHNMATRFLWQALEEHGSKGLEFIRDFEDYLTDKPEKKIDSDIPFSVNTIQAYRAQCMRLMHAGATLFATSTSYPQAERCYGWIQNKEDMLDVVEHAVASTMLKKRQKTLGPLPPTEIAQHQADMEGLNLQSQFLNVASYMAKVAKLRAKSAAANPVAPPSSAPCAATIPSESAAPTLPSAAKILAAENFTGSCDDPASVPTLPQGIPVALSESARLGTAEVQATQDPLLQTLPWNLPFTFPDLDLSYFEAPALDDSAAGHKRKADQAFSDSP
jgi:hypothetical protein